MREDEEATSIQIISDNPGNPGNPSNPEIQNMNNGKAGDSPDNSIRSHNPTDSSNPDRLGNSLSEEDKVCHDRNNPNNSFFFPDPQYIHI